MKNIKIVTAVHKKYWLPDDSIYLPLQVGFGEDLGINRDNTGNNISNKNANYCELTALYWVNENMDNFDFIGLDHYRRHFSNGKKLCCKKEKVLRRNDIEPLLKDDVVVLPKKREYFIETNYTQYIHAHNEIDLIKTRQIISEKYPNYLDTYDKIMSLTNGHRFNMMIMPRQIFKEYTKWLFDILFELERRLDIHEYTDNDKRVFGFVAERLMDVYIENNNIKFIELPYVFMEKQNWIIKVFNFLKRKTYAKK